MFSFSTLKGEQVRQTIDTEQVFQAWREISQDIRHSFSGSMAWKTVAGKDYLYRKAAHAWKSLGPRSAETELAHAQFHGGRSNARNRLASLSSRLDEMAAINRAMLLGRMPLTTARIIRALDKAGLVGSAVDVVGTNALFGYERLSGVRIESGLLATGDIDLLFDARTNLNLLRRNLGPDGLMGILKTADKSFDAVPRGGFRAANKDGYLVDLIGALPADPIGGSRPAMLSENGDNLAAVEIEGLQWLINSPKVTAIVLDERGYPVQFSAPDPRSFALHKLWLSQRLDRDPLKRPRDKAQAYAIAQMLRLHSPHLRFDDAALGALPKSLRSLADALQGSTRDPPPRTSPDW